MRTKPTTIILAAIVAAGAAGAGVAHASSGEQSDAGGNVCATARRACVQPRGGGNGGDITVWDIVDS